jgi:hypothetical protein
MKSMCEDKDWIKLDLEIQNEILFKNCLLESQRPVVNLDTSEDIHKTLKIHNFKAFEDKVSALPNRFVTALAQAVKVLQPKVQLIKLPSFSLQTEEDIDSWVNETQHFLKNLLSKGPIRLI